MQPHSFAINILGRANNAGPVAKVASGIVSDFTSYLGYEYIVFAYILVRYSILALHRDCISTSIDQDSVNHRSQGTP